MTENKVTTKPRSQLDLDFFELNICKNKEDQPFLNVFSFSGKNYEEQRLGQVFGVIQVLDKSEHSAYIPNLIAQVIKKEYYRDRKRTVEKAFEAALHKANLALTDLAQHEIIEWMGKLNAVIGAVQKNNFFFTQAGGGRILLFRNKLINDITRGLDDGEGIGHPIKTFSNISSGKIEFSDKLIFATESVFESVKWEELKRHSQVFSSMELDNIFRSTLELESELSGAILINAKEKQIADVPMEKKKEEKIRNFFGAESKESEKVEKEGVKDVPLMKQKAEEKTGQEQQAIHTEKKELIEKVQEKPVEEDAKQNIENAQEQDGEEGLSPFEKQPELFVSSDDQFPEEKPGPSLGEKTKVFIGGLKSKLTDSFHRNKTLGKNKIPDIKKFMSKNKEKALMTGKESMKKIKIPNFKKFIPQRKNAPQATDKTEETPRPSLENKRGGDFALKYRNALGIILRKTKELTEKIPIPGKRGWVAVISTIVLLIVIFSFLKIRSGNQPSREASDPIAQTNGPEENIKGNLAVEVLADFDKNISSLAFLNGRIYVLTDENRFFEINPDNREKKEIGLPENAGKFSLLTQMPPLNLVFLINNNSVYSYSPVTGKFDSNNINLPQNLNAVSAGAYLTYLYVLDQNSGQVYQYPRATGGFGGEKARLDNQIQQAQLTDMAIDGSIYIAEKNQPVKKFFKGEEEDFGFNEKIEDPLVWAKNGSDMVVVADKTLGKIFILKNDGSLSREIQDPRIVQIRDFWYDQDKKSIYFASQNNEIIKINLD